MLSDLCTLVRPQAEVWLGGAAALLLAPSELPAGCVLMADLAPYEERLRLLQTQPS